MTRPIPSVTEMMGQLVAVPSVSAFQPSLDQGNRQVVELLAGWAKDLGFRAAIQPLPGQPGKANLIATLGEGDGGLVLAGHTDTVPYDEGRWTSDPFTLSERNGRLYGLGIADMKGFFALALEAARQVAGTKLTRPLILLATADEESSMAGAKALTAADLGGARHAVIGEPTGMTPVRMHKGMMMESIRLEGRSGHSSDPSLGCNALDGMQRVMGALMEWRRQWEETRRDPRFAVPFPTLNLGHIHGGDQPNRICAACELHIDVRPLPGMTLDDVRGELRRRVEESIAGTGLNAELAPLFEGLPPMETGEDSALVRELQRLTGQEAGAVQFGTEGPYLNALGMETVIMGPGNVAQAHQPDEYLEAARLNPTVDLLTSLICPDKY